ncbi:DEAD/DEAH box helicase [Ordospora pajunii]|uniref:DEAD/DEAH box helicase n=1 Tax=Ordospora pajunii TaxID=3039483 RepID=UPI00295276A9|nr:DEAD/DEAH box helicase [Ordospora pajunii]KAH9411357.1 DEAD/DEAH box helicase [Ordospora pajunii]
MEKEHILKRLKSKIIEKINMRAVEKELHEDTKTSKSVNEEHAIEADRRKSLLKIASSVEIIPLDAWPNGFDMSILPTNPTDIQKIVIPYIFAKQSFNATSETGSGKTLSYVLPYVKILQEEFSRLLVIVPTRELVGQVSKLFAKFSLDSLRIVEVTGGSSVDIQRLKLSDGFSVVVGTPGRLRELMEARCFGKIDYLVIDEVDKVMSYGLKEDAEYVLNVAEVRIVGLFSATPFEYPGIARIVIGDASVSSNVCEFFEYVKRSERLKVLRQILSGDHLVDTGKKGADSGRQGMKVIVFCNTIRMCDYLNRRINESVVLHSKKSMDERRNAVKRMDSAPGVLIATDLGARGVDIKDIDLVVNYEFPSTIETYIHRCGRAGRQRMGMSLSMIDEEDKMMFRKIKRHIVGRGKEVPVFLEVDDDAMLD